MQRLHRLLRLYQTAPLSLLSRSSFASSVKSRHEGTPSAISPKPENVKPLSDVVSENFFPSGQADFSEIRSRQQFYIDKTRFISIIEKGASHIMFLRPARFGKSLFLSMLETYYNVSTEEQFDELFVDLFIHKQPTPERNSYHILPLDLSIGVAGSADAIEQKLHECINGALSEFSKDYELKYDILPSNSFESLKRMANALRRKDKNAKLLILIDEYDRFANKLMFESPALYSDIVAGKSGDPASSPIRSFYETLKTLDKAKLKRFRTISTGLSPITLADASGANFITDVTHNEGFADAAGFSEADLRQGLAAIGVRDKDQEAPIAVMRKFYNGYNFSGSKISLYNSTLALFFLNKYHRNKNEDSVYKPFHDFVAACAKNEYAITTAIQGLYDRNVKISGSVLGILKNTPGMKLSLVQNLFANKSVEAILVKSFKLNELMEPEPYDPEATIYGQTSYHRAVSFMYYHGLVTRDSKNPNLFHVPNEMVIHTLLNELDQRLQNQAHEVLALFRNPTEEQLVSVFQPIIDIYKKHHDNSFSEGALQIELTASLRAIAYQSRGAFKIVIEDKILDSNLRSDIVLTQLVGEKVVIVIELKRVRPNALVVENWKLPKKWHPNSFEAFDQNLQCLLEDKTKPQQDSLLRELKIEEYRQELYNGAKTVDAIEAAAEGQVRCYAEAYASVLPQGTPIHTFTVVHVAYPLLVRKIDTYIATGLTEQR